MLSIESMENDETEPDAHERLSALLVDVQTIEALTNAALEASEALPNGRDPEQAQAIGRIAGLIEAAADKARAVVEEQIAAEFRERDRARRARR